MSETTYNRTTKHAGNEAQDALNSATNTASEIGRRAGDTAAEAGAAMQDAARKVYGAASDIGHEAVVRGKRYGKDVVKQVEREPMISVMIAASVGFVAGLLVSRH